MDAVTALTSLHGNSGTTRSISSSSNSNNDSSIGPISTSSYPTILSTTATNGAIPFMTGVHPPSTNAISRHYSGDYTNTLHPSTPYYNVGTMNSMDPSGLTVNGLFNPHAVTTSAMYTSNGTSNGTSYGIIPATVATTTAVVPPYRQHLMVDDTIGSTAYQIPPISTSSSADRM